LDVRKREIGGGILATEILIFWVSSHKFPELK
jgi:hypothetical protein